MVVGYITIFNDPATITRLRTTTKIPEDVSFEARAVAASPILAIEATADDPKVAQDAAMTWQGVRADINESPAERKGDYIAELKRQLAEIPPVDPSGSANPYYASLQERIDRRWQFSCNELLFLQATGRRHRDHAEHRLKTRVGGRGWTAARHPRRAGSGRSYQHG